MTQVTMPKLGESVTEGTILQWFKQPGDPVALDDALCEIETEKVTAELPSPFEGTMGAIHVQVGETVPVGALLCEVTEAGAAPAATPASRPVDVAPPREDTKAEQASGWSGGPMAIPPDGSEQPAPVAIPVRRTAQPATPVAPVPRVPLADHPVSGSPEERSRFYSPAVLRLAREHNVDLSAIAGSGIGGRVTRRDVERSLTVPAPQLPGAAPAPVQPRPAASPAVEPQPVSTSGYSVRSFTATRRAIAANLVRSNLEAPQAWLMVEVDVTGLMRLREHEKAVFLAREGVELTLLPYFTSTVCEALRDVPVFNARWDGEELREYRDLNIGIAVAAESGLVVPVIHGAGDLSIAGLARRIADLATRARDRKLRVEDIEGGTFTVNNTGAFGSVASRPIVNYPQVAIITMERAVKRPVVTAEDAIAIRWMMNVCLSFDHRVADGLEAGAFLGTIKRRLEALQPAE